MRKQTAAIPPQSGVRWQKLQDGQPTSVGDAQGVRLTAVEAQMNAMHQEFRALRSEFVELKEKFATRTNEDPPVIGAPHGLFGPSDGTRWGDLEPTEMEMAHGAEEAVEDELQRCGSSTDEAAQQKLVVVDYAEVATQTDTQHDVQAAVGKLIQILQISRCTLQPTPPISAMCRMYGELATAALTALGLTSSDIEKALHNSDDGDQSGARGDNEGGVTDVMDVEDQDIPDGDHHEDHFHEPSRDDHLRGAIHIDDDMGSATEPEEDAAEPHSEPREAQAPACTDVTRWSDDDELENIIAMAQHTHEQETQWNTWPLPLPSIWYTEDPKRAVRCLVRAALGWSPQLKDLSFRTETLRTRYSSGELRLQFRTVVHFGVWDQTFHGKLQPSVSLAERDAFRVSLDKYHQWIFWQDDDTRCLAAASRAARTRQ